MGELDETARSEGASHQSEKDAAAALSVSAALSLAKKTLETLVVRIVGEVSEVSVRSGYRAAYFTVKDEEAALSCMMWNNRYKAQGFELQVGQLIEVTGRFSIYAAKGRMNFDVFSFKLAGEGDLRMRVANIARKLEAEGLTDPSRKLPLPVFPESIGLVTSPRGAAVHDVLRTLRRRFPLAKVYLAGVPVEGATAAEGIVNGMREVYRRHPDVILLVRGGGSFEDLMPFNDETLARAICKSRIPIVTGIGHEVDTTIADMVSDFRASTPTAAAEAVSPSAESLQDLFSSREGALHRSATIAVERMRARVEGVQDRPVFKDPFMLLSQGAQAVDYAQERLTRSLPLSVARQAERVDAMAFRLERALPPALERQHERIAIFGARMDRALPAIVQQGKASTESANERLARVAPSLTEPYRVYTRGIADRFSRSLGHAVDSPRSDTASREGRLARCGSQLTERFAWQLGQAAGRLDDLSPVSALARGFAIARDERGGIVRHVAQAPVGSTVQVTVSDGAIVCCVQEAREGDPLKTIGADTASNA